MRNLVTTLLLGVFLLSFASSTLAQPLRTDDVIWARDIDGATITMDGVLDEEVWQQAETITLQRGTFYEPGGGWQDHEIAAALEGEPTDPVDATIYLLRDGNTLWVGVEARDKSIGGQPRNNFFQHDGVVMSIADKRNIDDAYDGTMWSGSNWGNGSVTDEFFYSWLTPPGLADTVGIGPQFFGNEVTDGVPNEGVWDAAAVVDGVSNDDTNGTGTATDDVGYTMEIMINLDELGYDMTDADGDRLPFTIGVYDLDYRWPTDPDLSARTRAWWQNPWGGDMPYGVGFVYGHPDVTVDTEYVEPMNSVELTIPRAPFATITVDGELDEQVWSEVDPQISLKYQMTPEELEELPGYGPYYTHWFRPGGGETAPPVLDASTGQIRLLYQGSMLYVGLDTDDQAINGVQSEGGADGLGITIRTGEPKEEGDIRHAGYWFRVSIDTVGTLSYDIRKPTAETPDPDVEAALFLKPTDTGPSTIADPTDIDEGYQIEMAIDLSTLVGYEDGIGDLGGIIWVGANYFDGDNLEDPTQSYNMRTWFLTERTDGPAARAFLDYTTSVAVEGEVEVPQNIVLYGNYPNPFNPSTMLKYALPQTGEVQIHVFDVLGREVARVTPGMQQAGINTYSFEAAGLASGLYLYRVDLRQQAGNVRSSVTGRMLLLK